jgi:hypothetical protein
MFTNSKMLLGALGSGPNLDLLLLLFLLLPIPLGRMAQTPQGFGQGQVLDNMKAASTAMKAFYKEHGNMPASQADFDIVLQGLYSDELSGSRTQPATNGAYRVLGDYRITLDPTVANVDPEMWRRTSSRALQRHAGQFSDHPQRRHKDICNLGRGSFRQSNSRYE